MDGRDLVSIYTAPATRLGRWLVEPGLDVSPAIRPMLLAGLFGTLTIFMGGIFNTAIVSAIAAYRHPTPAFLAWLMFEVVLGTIRIGLLAHARCAAKRGERCFTDLYLMLAIGWAAGVGYGGFLGLASGDGVVAALAGISAAGMAGGIAFRNFYAPRLCTVMVVLSFGPCAIGAAMSGEHALWLLLPQVPIYLLTLRSAVYDLNAMLVRTIAAEQENDRRASHDQLTGLANRAGLERAIEAWRRRAGRLGPIALFYCDLDGFKGVNDRHGHAAGDALLRMVAIRLAMLAPDGGLAARIGGDEFVLLLPEDDLGGMVGRAERVIAAIADRPYELPGNVSVTIGVSIGIARLPDHGRDLGALMSAADTALYEAKARGRCRAIVADVSPAPSPATVPPVPRIAAAR